MLTLIKNFLKEEEGTETVEWAILAALLLAGGGVVWGQIGTAVSNTMGGITPLVTTP